MNKQEYYDIVYNLEKYHEVFSTLWRICQPIFTNTIDTAAVFFDKSGNCFNFHINPDFWDSLDDYNKEFCICHEMLHVILNHGLRSSPHRDKYTGNVINVALDLSVNHLLTNLFNFNRFKIKNWEKLCWADTVLEDKDLEPDKSYEHYINKIDPNKIEQNIIINLHDNLKSFDKDSQETIQKTINTLLGNNDLDKNQKQKNETDKLLVEVSKGYSNDTGLFQTFIGEVKNYRKIKKWESVLDKYVLKSEKDREITQWLRTNRRLNFIKSKLFLPSDAEVTDIDFYRYNIWLFLDYSGSCSNLKNMFFIASQTFDPKKFRIRKFAHTTDVFEFKGNNCNTKGGGTSFQCIENYIQKSIKSGDIKKYPDAVFHFTDGDAAPFMSESPEKWYVFLPTHSYKRAFPQNTNFFELADFVEGYIE